jgi:hypothetical protein
MQQQLKKIQLQVLCFIFFMIPAIIILSTGVLTKNILPRLSQILFFILGWLTWTFLEYIAHRFWMHNKTAQKEKPALGGHMYHHTHPTELKISNSDRFLLLSIGLVILIIAFYLFNYFIIFAGFYWGFLSYTFMHVMLHRKWAKNFFPGLLQNHILHHCKFSNKCFGVTVTFWDKIFATSAPRSYQISEKVISYYFGETAEKKETEKHENLKINLQLNNN